MKLFKSLLIAPATLGLLATSPAISSEVDFQAISQYSEAEYEIDSNSFNYLPTNNNLLSGGEGLLESIESSSPDSFSETTSASFTAEAVLGALTTDDLVPANNTDKLEAVSFEYQYQIGLTSSFTGEDSLDVTIDVGGAGPVAGTSATNTFMGFDATEDVMTVDGVTYTFPVGGATMLVGDSTDISALYTGACAYSGFADYITDCGTGNSIGVGGAGATVAAAYAFDGGFSISGGVSSPNVEILGEAQDGYGVEAAYSADNYGVAIAFADVETATTVGLNGFYTFDFATISAGYETMDVDLAGADDTSAFFVGLTKEVGPGTAEIGYLSTDMDPYLLGVTETTYLYEASYAYPVNDVLTITPGVGMVDADGAEFTVAAVKASFSF